MRRIAQETINRVLEEVDILDVISQYVDLKKRGKNYFGLSPFRSETKPSFSVAPDKNMWYDFGSGQGGNALDAGRYPDTEDLDRTGFLDKTNDYFTKTFTLDEIGRAHV